MRARALAAAVAVFAAWLAAAPLPPAAARPGLVGERAPEITPTAWIGGDGSAGIADFRGQLLLLNFWDSH